MEESQKKFSDLIATVLSKRWLNSRGKETRPIAPTNPAVPQIAPTKRRKKS